MDRLAKSDPSDARWQHDLAVSMTIGYVQVAQGNLPAALASYQAARHYGAFGEVRSRQCQMAAGLGGVVRERRRREGRAGQSADALASYQAGQAIFERLAKSDPGNADWQRGLSVSYAKSERAEGAGKSARPRSPPIRPSLAIADRLAKSDPGNAGWQSDLAASYDNVGDVDVAQGNLPVALASYQTSFAIRERLAKSDPGNAGWQHELAAAYRRSAKCRRRRAICQPHWPPIRRASPLWSAWRSPMPAMPDGSATWRRSYDRVGDLQVEQGNLPEALASYQTSFAIRERLAKSDPGNADWQRDLSVLYGKVGNVQVAQGNLPAAMISYQARLVIAEHLATSDPGNAGWQRDLAAAQSFVGNVQVEQGNLSGALASYQASLAIIEHLATSNLGNAGLAARPVGFV